MCLSIMKDYSKKPIPVVVCTKMLMEGTGSSDVPSYHTPYQYTYVPRNGVIVPDSPLFGGKAMQPVLPMPRRRHKGIVEGGLIHAFHIPNAQYYDDVDSYGRKLCKAVAFGVEYIGKKNDITSRVVYVSVCDKYHTDDEKEEFMKFCENLHCSPKIDAEDQEYIMNFIYGQEDE